MKRAAKVVGISLLGLVGLAAASWLGLGFYLSPQSPLQKSDAIVAISGGDTGARVQAAVQLYKAHYAPKLIFSGAALDPSSPSNAQVMASQAEADGVPASAVTLEETSTDTMQNANNVAQIVHAAHYKSVILVTSPYHQRRASILFHRSLGPDVTIINHSSLDPGWRRSDWWATSASRQLTLAELQKTIYTLFNQ